MSQKNSGRKKDKGRKNAHGIRAGSKVRDPLQRLSSPEELSFEDLHDTAVQVVLKTVADAVATEELRRTLKLSADMSRSTWDQAVRMLQSPEDRKLARDIHSRAVKETEECQKYIFLFTVVTKPEFLIAFIVMARHGNHLYKICRDIFRKSRKMALRRSGFHLICNAVTILVVRRRLNRILTKYIDAIYEERDEPAPYSESASNQSTEVQNESKASNSTSSLHEDISAVGSVSVLSGPESADMMLKSAASALDMSIDKVRVFAAASGSDEKLMTEAFVLMQAFVFKIVINELSLLKAMGPGSLNGSLIKNISSPDKIRQIHHLLQHDDVIKVAQEQFNASHTYELIYQRISSPEMRGYLESFHESQATALDEMCQSANMINEIIDAVLSANSGDVGTVAPDQGIKPEHIKAAMDIFILMNIGGRYGNSRRTISLCSTSDGNLVLDGSGEYAKLITGKSRPAAKKGKKTRGGSSGKKGARELSAGKAGRNTAAAGTAAADAAAAGTVQSASLTGAADKDESASNDSCTAAIAAPDATAATAELAAGPGAGSEAAEPTADVAPAEVPAAAAEPAGAEPHAEEDAAEAEGDANKEADSPEVMTISSESAVPAGNIAVPVDSNHPGSNENSADNQDGYSGTDRADASHAAASDADASDPGEACAQELDIPVARAVKHSSRLTRSRSGTGAGGPRNMLRGLRKQAGNAP